MALTTIYIIDSTDGSTSFAIQPRTFDGINGVQQNTDLTLYGNSTPTWGERFNENFYHTLENFAVDKKGFNPGVDTFDPTDATLPIPKDQFDLSVTGLGVNNPIEGQLWYNKTDTKLYVYSSTGWRPTGMASTSPPTSPIAGDLWFDGTVLELKFYNGTTWKAVSTESANFVLKTGDTMTGDLNLSSNLPTLFFTEEDETTGSQIWAIKGQTGDLIFQALDNISTGSGGGNVFKFTRTTNQVDSFEALQSGITWLNINNTSKSLTLTSAGSLILEHDPVLALEAATKQYVDTVVGGGGGVFVAITGDTMTGDLELNTSNNTERKISLSTQNDISNGGTFEIRHGDTTGATYFTTNYNNIPINIMEMSPFPPGYITIFHHNVTVNGQTTFNDRILLNDDLQMQGTGRAFLNVDPTIDVEAATKRYVDNNILNNGRLLIENRLDYNTYFDVNTDTPIIIPNFDVAVNISTAPVTYTINAKVSAYHNFATSPTIWEVGIIGGEYGALTVVGRTITEGTSSDSIIINGTIITSGQLAQNTTYTFVILARNAIGAATQNTRLNASDNFQTSSDPSAISTIQALIYSL